MKISSYSKTTYPVDGVCRQSAIWASDGKCGVYPIAYIRRPKWIKSDAAWEKIIAAIKLELPEGTEID